MHHEPQYDLCGLLVFHPFRKVMDVSQQKNQGLEKVFRLLQRQTGTLLTASMKPSEAHPSALALVEWCHHG